MATITTSWVTYASKTFKPGTGLSVTFQLQARQTAQSVANNTSTIQTRLRSVINSGQGSGYNYKFTCSYASSVSGSGLWTLQNETITTSSNKVISHNNDGTKTITLSATAVISGLSMNLSMSANVNLQKINRIATITTVYGFNQKGIFPPEVLFKNPANFNLYLGVDIIDKNNHGVYTIQTPVAAKYNSPYVFDMTDEWDSLLQNTTTQKKYKARYFIQTMSGSSQIGIDTEDEEFYIIEAEPTFTAVYEDINSTTTAITGDNQKIIRNQSNLQINISNATAKYYATLTSIKAVINGITYNGTLSGTTGTIPVGTIDVSENIEAAVTLTDSRGYTTTNNIEIQVLNWELPTANISLARQNNYYSETDIKVDANYSSLDGDNVITIKERHKKTTSSTYSAYTTLTDNVTSTLTLDNLYEWDVQVLVQDLFGSTTYNLTLDKGMPIIYFDRIKRSVSINCFPANNESLEVESKLYLNNQNIGDYIYDTGWITITPTNGTAGTGYYVPQYRRVGKLVTMRGYITVKNNTAMFTLPDGYRPSARLTFAGTNDNRNVNEIRVVETGDVRLLGTTGTLSSGVACFLDNVSYFID